MEIPVPGEVKRMGNLFSLEGKILYLPIHMVRTRPDRRERNTARLQELAASIGEVGILQPLTVRKNGEQYVIVSGVRRYQAARMAGLGEVPCILLNVNEADAELITLTENLQREDLHYFQEAEYLSDYLVKSGLTQGEAAGKLGRSQSALANKLRLLQHAPAVREKLREYELTERHARELLRVRGTQARLAVLEEIAEKGLNVSQTCRYIDCYLRNHGEDVNSRIRSRETRLFLDRIRQDTQALLQSGIRTDVTRQDNPEEIILTVTIHQQEPAQV